MEHIVEEFGAAFLGIIASGAVLGIIISCMQQGGIFYMAVTAYLGQLCG